MPAISGTTALLVGLGASAAGSVAGAALSSRAAGKAAKTQAQAAEEAARVQGASADKAAELQKKAADDALAFQRYMFDVQQGNLRPWLGTGSAAMGRLGTLMGLPAAPAPTGTYVDNYPLPAVPQTVGLGTTGTGTTTPAGGGRGRTMGDILRDLAPGERATLMEIARAHGWPLANEVIDDGQPQGQVPGTFVDSYPAPAGPETRTLGQGLIPPGVSAQPPPPGGPQDPDFGSLMQPWQGKWDPSKYGFTPPDVTEDPGFAFRLAEGAKALERSAAARGNLLTGGTAKALERYAQDYASNEYDNAYRRRMAENELARQRAFEEYQNSRGEWETGKANQFNRLAALAGVGQTAAGEMGRIGSTAAGNVGSLLTGTASRLGDIYMGAGRSRAEGLTDAANARASGYVAGSNAWGNALTNAGGSVMNAYLLNKLLKQRQPYMGD